MSLNISVTAILVQNTFSHKKLRTSRNHSDINEDPCLVARNAASTVVKVPTFQEALAYSALRAVN